MQAPSRLSTAGQYVEWLRLQVHEKPLPSGDRARAGAACLALAQEHHHSIIFLGENRLFGSAFALVRIAFEAYIRGEWLISCATNKQVGGFVRAKEPPKIDALIEAIETKPGFNARTLSALKKRHWRAMCAYTHSGGLHAQRWQTSSGVEPNYSDEEVEEVVFFAEVIGSLSAIALAGLSSDEETANLILHKFEERMK